MCTADSTHLEFVPDESFDLVYTGYISPLLNPLQLQGTMDQNFEVYQSYCEDTDNTTMAALKAQDIQADWYGA